MKMKKLAAAIAAAMVLAASAVCLTACGGGTPAVNDTSVSAQQDVFVLEGTWQITEATAQGVDAVEAAKQMGKEDQMTVTFQNGVATVNLMGDITTGSYTYENGVLNLEGGIAKIDGNRIEFNVEGVHMVLEKKGGASNIGGTESSNETKYETAVDSIQSLNGTTWRITSMTEDGEEVSDELNGATATFTADKMILSYDGETEYVDYTLTNGIIDAEGITGTVSDKRIVFHQGSQILVMEKTSGIAVDTPSYSDNSTLTSLVGTTWRITKITDDGEDMTAELNSEGGATATFTADEMLLSFGGESEHVEYTYSNGVIDADGIKGTCNGNTLTFVQGDEILVMERIS